MNNIERSPPLSELLQRVLERPLEKKAGRTFAPPGNKRLVYFIDDINMPMVRLQDIIQGVI